MASSATFTVEEKTIEPILIAGVRLKGAYSECSKGFSRIGRSMGRLICGPPFCLHYDTDYKEGDADFEACFPIKEKRYIEGILVRELPGGPCLSLLHQGPYEGLTSSYAKIREYVCSNGYHTIIPSREIYLRGPGMIFKGNRRKYVTEIQMMIEETIP